MTTPPIPKFLQTIGVENAVRLARMTQEHAERWLDLRFPDLPQEEREQILKIPRAQSKENARDPFRARNEDQKKRERLFILVAWLCGASMNQLARLHGVTRQTIYERVDRQLSSEIRQDFRLADSMPTWRLSLMRETFYGMFPPGDELLQTERPEFIASQMQIIVPETNPEDEHDALS